MIVSLLYVYCYVQVNMLLLELRLLWELSWFDSEPFFFGRSPLLGCDIKRLLQTLSSWATSSVEEVASTGPGIRFFQLYVSFIVRYITRP